MFNKYKGPHNGSRKGQSTVEYIVLVTAVISVALLFLTNNKTGSLQNRMGSVYQTAGLGIKNASDVLANSHALTNQSSPEAAQKTPVTGFCQPPQSLQPDGTCA